MNSITKVMRLCEELTSLRGQVSEKEREIAQLCGDKGDRVMSEAVRNRISQRMRAYWKARKGAQK